MFVRRLARAVIAWEWLFLLALLPAVLVAPHKLAVGLLLVPLLWLFRGLATGRILPLTALNPPMLLLLFMVLVSMFATFDIAFSFSKIAGMVYGVAVFYGVAAAAQRSHGWLWAGVALFFGAGLGIANVSLLTVRWPQKLPLLSSALARIPDILINFPGAVGAVSANEVAGVLLWIVPGVLVLAGAFFLRLPTWRRQLPRWQFLGVIILLPLTALFLTSTLLLTQSRAALLGFGGAFLFVVIVVAGRYRRFILFGAAAVIIATTGAAAIGTFDPVDAGKFVFMQAGVNTEEISDPINTLAGRQEIWTRALYGIQDFPFTGMGMNTFRRMVHILYPFFLIMPDFDVAHAHNHLLQTALDLGLPGLIAYIAIWFGAAGMLWEIWHKSTSFYLRGLALGFAASLLAYFLYGIFDTVALGARPAFLFWWLLGLVAGLHRLTVSVSSPLRLPHTSPR
jgi:putative inorganic carbon (HCO3(-)) transporter